MPDWATSGGIKVERAKKHIGDLETEITAFKKRYPYTSLTQDNPKTGEWFFCAVIPKEPKIEWGAIVGDAIHNLRSSLDILWNCVYHVRRGGFPFFDTAKTLEAILQRKKDGRRKTVMDILKNAEPYKRRDCLLWQLHSLDIRDKHHILLPVITAVRKMTVDMNAIFRNGRHGGVGANFVVRQLEKPVYSVHNGTVLYRAPINPDGLQVDMDPQFTFDIAFGQGEIVEGQPILATLNKFAESVDSLVDAFIAAGFLP